MASYNSNDIVIRRMSSVNSGTRLLFDLQITLKVSNGSIGWTGTVYKTGITDGETIDGERISILIKAPEGKRIVRACGYIVESFLPMIEGIYPFRWNIKVIYDDDTTDTIECNRFAFEDMETDLVRVAVGWYADRPGYSNFQRLAWRETFGFGLTPLTYDFGIGLVMYKTETEADRYLDTGEEGEPINPYEPTSTDVKYIHCRIYENSQPIKIEDYFHEVTTNNIDIPYDYTQPGYNGLRPVAGWIYETPQGYYNIELIENDDVKYTGKIEEEITPRSESSGNVMYKDSLSECTNPAWCYKEMIYVNNKYYFGSYTTNIPLFTTRQKALDYLHGLIGEEDIPTGNDTGEPIEQTDFNDVNGESIGCEVLCLHQSEAQSFFQTLFTPDDSLSQQILDGLKMWGTNPMDFIVDYFAIPFEASSVCDITYSQEVSFGKYVHKFPHAKPRMTNVAPKLVDCFSINVNGEFEDWRDYESNYYLYLPYVGITNIDINKYIYKTMSCKVAVDVRTGQIKYYLLANNKLIDTFETVCRVSLPMTTTNMYSNTREKLDNITNAVTSIATAQDPNAIFDALKLPKMTTSGNCSPSNAWIDPSICYLIIQSPEYVYEGVTSVYGMPDNKISTIGSLSGYVEADDVVLAGCGDCSENEKNIIKNLIREGIFV